VRIEEWNELHDMVIGACAETLASIECSARYVGTVPHRVVDWAETVSIIGLGGRLKGSLVLSMSADLVRASHPTRSVDPSELADWIAELANLVLGRVKARLLTHGLALDLCTPLALSARALRFERFAGTPVVYAFEAGAEKVFVVFDAIADEGLGLAPMRAGVVASPGDVITF
jgi:CheY-specific phosphatase CheX